MIYGYVRKSNEEGVDSSFETQRYKINSYCNLKGLQIDEWFYDVVSGGTLITQRTQGTLMSSKLKKGDIIVCSELSRYSRSHIGLVNDVEKYRKNKIQLHFTDLGDVISADSLGSVFYKILSIMSEWYRTSLSEKQKITKDRMKKQNKYRGGRVQFSKDIGENGVLVDCEKQKRELNLILGLRQKDTKLKDIKSFMEKYTGRKWWISYIHKLIKRHETDYYIENEEMIRNQICQVELERNICDV
tara:strand:- start:220 stop:951 length:732 start_codon:yes stop_codon:yes gene_type:complete